MKYDQVKNNGKRTKIACTLASCTCLILFDNLKSLFCFGIFETGCMDCHCVKFSSVDQLSKVPDPV